VSIVAESEGNCPACGAPTFKLVGLLYDIPHFGNTVLWIGHCRTCGYRYFDLEYAESGQPTRIIFKAENGEDVAKSWLIRSKTGSIKSPELGFDLEPGPSAEPFITTVEGFLYRALDYAERLEALEPEKADKVEEFMAKVRRAIDEGGFTLIVEDPQGKSAIIPRRPEIVRVERLSSTS
jgi:zinc finger protein